jgi:hypothetical protein
MAAACHKLRLGQHSPDQESKLCNYWHCRDGSLTGQHRRGAIVWQPAAAALSGVHVTPNHHACPAVAASPSLEKACTTMYTAYTPTRSTMRDDAHTVLMHADQSKYADAWCALHAQAFGCLNSRCHDEPNNPSFKLRAFTNTRLCMQTCGCGAPRTQHAQHY